MPNTHFQNQNNNIHVRNPENINAMADFNVRNPVHQRRIQENERETPDERDNRYDRNYIFNEPAPQNRNVNQHFLNVPQQPPLLPIASNILQLTADVPIFDSNEESFENFERACKTINLSLAIPNQRTFIRHLSNKFAGPVAVWIFNRLENYPDISAMLKDVKRNFLKTTPIYLLENQIFQIFQHENESVRDYGARMSLLLERIERRILSDETLTRDELRVKLNDLRKRVRYQFIEGLCTTLFNVYSNHDFRNYSLNDMIRTVENGELKQIRHERNEKARHRKVNFESDKNDNTDLADRLDKLTIAYGHIKDKVYSKNFNRDFSKDRYYKDNSRKIKNNDRYARRESDRYARRDTRRDSDRYSRRDSDRYYRQDSNRYSRRDKYNSTKNRQFSNHRYPSEDKRRSNSRNWSRSNSRNRSYSRDKYNHNSREPSYDRHDDRKKDRKTSNSRERNSSRDRSLSRENKQDRDDNYNQYKNSKKKPYHKNKNKKQSQNSDIQTEESSDSEESVKN